SCHEYHENICRTFVYNMYMLKIIDRNFSFRRSLMKSSSVALKQGARQPTVFTAIYIWHLQELNSERFYCFKAAKNSHPFSSIKKQAFLKRACFYLYISFKQIPIKMIKYHHSLVS